jgi:hypothetical protein
LQLAICDFLLYHSCQLHAVELTVACGSMSEDFSRPPKIPPRRAKRRAGPGPAHGNDAPRDESGTALPEISARDALGYASDTLAELSRLSRKFGHETLAYMIEVAHLEAQTRIQEEDAAAKAASEADPEAKPGRR